MLLVPILIVKEPTVLLLVVVAKFAHQFTAVVQVGELLITTNEEVSIHLIPINYRYMVRRYQLM